MFFKDTGVLCVSHGFKHGRPPLPQLTFQQRRNRLQLPSSSLLPTHLGPCTDWSLPPHHLRKRASLLCTDSFPISLSSPKREKNGLCDTWKQRGQCVEEQAAQRLPTGLGCRNMWVKLGFSLWNHLTSGGFCLNALTSDPPQGLSSWAFQNAVFPTLVPPKSKLEFKTDREMNEIDG